MLDWLSNRWLTSLLSDAVLAKKNAWNVFTTGDPTELVVNLATWKTTLKSQRASNADYEDRDAWLDKVIVNIAKKQDSSHLTDRNRSMQRRYLAFRR